MEYANNALGFDSNNPEFLYALSRANLGLNQVGEAENNIGKANDVFVARNDNIGLVKVNLTLAEIAYRRNNLD